MLPEQSQTAATLGCGSHLALKGLRHAVLGRPNTHLFTYQQAFGADAIDASRLFRAFMELLGLSARRPVQLRQVCCGLMTPNEVSLLQFLSAAGDGRQVTEQSHLNWIARPFTHSGLRELGGLIAGLFSAHGMEITAPCGAAPAPDSPRPLELCEDVTPAAPEMASGKAAYRQ